MNKIEQALWNEEVIPLSPYGSLYRWVENLSEPFLRRLNEDNELLYDTVEYIDDVMEQPFDVVFKTLADEITQWVAPTTSGKLQLRYWDTPHDF